MALADFIPTIWDARFTSKLRDNLVWGSRANSNFEGDIAQAGDTVKIPTSTTTITVGDYVESTDITNEDEANGTTQDLVVDQQKYFRFYVDDIHEAQTRPNLMDDAMGQAAFKMADVEDDFYKNVFVGGYNASRNVTVSGDPTTDAQVQKVLKAFTQIALMMDEANLPQEGRWAIVSPLLKKQLTDRFAIEGNASGVFVPAASDSTLRNGFIGRLFNFDLLTTNKTDEVTIATKKHDRFWFGQGNEAVTRATQIVTLESYRPENRFGDAVKGLRVYGAKNVIPARLYTVSAQNEA